MLNQDISTRTQSQLGTPRSDGWHPLQSLQEEVDRLFSRYIPGRWGMSLLTGEDMSGFGALDVAETNDALDISVDVPGMTEKEIDLTLADGVLTIKGERKSEREEKKADYYRAERSFGAFQRRFTLPCEIDEAKVTAEVTKGVLKIRLPKSTRAKVTAHKIPIKSA